MDNLVGDNLPSTDKIAALLKKCVELRAEVSKLGIVLSPEQRKRRLRMRKGAMSLVPLLMSLVKKHGLEVASVPIAGMQADARLATELSPFEDHVTALSQLIVDTITEAEHELWQAFLMYYGILKSAAVRIPELKAELRPIEELLAQDRKKPQESDNPPAP
jgi:hypothetical protein